MFLVNSVVRLWNLACVKNSITQSLHVSTNKFLRIIGIIFFPTTKINIDLWNITKEETILKQIILRKGRWYGKMSSILQGWHIPKIFPSTKKHLTMHNYTRTKTKQFYMGGKNSDSSSCKMELPRGNPILSRGVTKKLWTVVMGK